MKKTESVTEISWAEHLALLTDDELFAEEKAVKSDIVRSYKTKQKSKDIEEYLCYVQRELSMRAQRAEYHKTWLQNNQVDY
jgi:hypothetical protein